MIRTYVEEITFKVVKTIEDNINPTKLPYNATRNYYYKILGVSEDADAAVKANLFLKF